MTKYFKLEDSKYDNDMLPQEGAIVIELNQFLLQTEMRGLDAPNEKFYLASSEGQILFLATPDE